MQTATMVIGTGPDNAAYDIGYRYQCLVRLRASPAAIILGDPTGTCTIAVTNAGAVTYTVGPAISALLPDRSLLGARNVPRDGLYPPTYGSTLLLLRAGSRFVSFGGWGHPAGIGIMTLWNATSAYSYTLKVDYTGINANAWALSGMNAAINNESNWQLDGEVILGSGRPGGPGSIRVESTTGFVEVWSDPCKIVMTSPSGAKWNVTPGVGGALGAVAG